MARRSFLTKWSALALTAVVLGAVPVRAQEDPAEAFFFRDGDRIQILGDSITQQRMYSTLVESFVLSRYPKWKISVRNTGWGGDTMGLRQRVDIATGFARDIAPLGSTAILVDFGMNDARYGNGGVEAYLGNARVLTDKFKAAGMHVALVSPSPEERYETGQPAGSAYNLTLRMFTDGLKTVANEKGVDFVDELNPTILDIESARRAGVLSYMAGGARLTADGVHPNWAGHLLLATHILEGLRAPALVSRVEIDAVTGKTQAYAAQVTQVQPGENLSFVRTDAALPWPIPPDCAPAYSIPDFRPLQTLSRFELKVTGLTAPHYQLAIDGVPVGTYDKAVLNAGINLSGVAAGPIYEQTRALLSKIMLKNDQFFDRWRNVQVYEPPAWAKANLEPSRQAELKRQDALIAADEAEIDALRQPKPHVWSLKPLP